MDFGRLHDLLSNCNENTVRGSSRIAVHEECNAYDHKAALWTTDIDKDFYATRTGCSKILRSLVRSLAFRRPLKGKYLTPDGFLKMLRGTSVYQPLSNT